MTTVVLGAEPAELEQLIARRRARGQDLFDEVWEGVYHMANAPHFRHGYLDDAITRLLGPYAAGAGLVGTGPFNLGTKDDFRVPDHGYHRSFSDESWLSSAVVVVEVVSPDDETYQKFDFYAAHEVDELIVADPRTQRISCYRRDGDHYLESPRSEALGVSAAELTESIDWM
ncbi:MAG: Uma2 family endonuclease [Acidimicrobiales bacterium]